jgi:hypothetical protein
MAGARCNKFDDLGGDEGMEETQADGTPKKIGRYDQLKRTHEELFRLCEVYVHDCLVVFKERRNDAHIFDTINKIRETYKLIQDTKEKQ